MHWSVVLGSLVFHEGVAKETFLKMMNDSIHMRACGSELSSRHPPGSVQSAVGTYEFEPSISEATVPNILWVIWFGRTLVQHRLFAWKSIKSKFKSMDVRLVTEGNVKSFEVKDEPYHPGFAHLSAVHKSDYLFSYLGHHYGGGFHDVKFPNRDDWSFEEMGKNTSLWMVGVWTTNPGTIACNEHAIGTDPDCVLMRSRRGEDAANFSSVKFEHRTSCINGSLDLWDAGRGACCEHLVRSAFRELLGVQNYIIRPKTALTARWLKLVHIHLDYKYDRLVRHPAPRAYPRCCFHHEFGYPINWAELKCDILHPVMRMYRAHLRGGLLPSIDLPKKEDVDVLGSGRMGWMDLSQTP